MASSIGRASAILASGTVVSRVLGFGKTWLLLQAIGTIGFSADAYATSTIVPTTIFSIVAQGLLNAILVPQIVRASTHSDGGRAYINKLVTLGILLFGGITIIATLCAPWLMAAFGVAPENQALATAFAYWSLPQIFFLGLYTLLGEVLNARKVFGPFSWSPVLSNLVAIAMLLVFIAAFGADAHGTRAVDRWDATMVIVLAGGVTLGVAAQALVLFFFWKKVGLRFRLDFSWRGVNLGDASKAAGWTFAMVIATQVAGIVQTIVANSASGFASTQSKTTAWSIFILPQSVITMSIAIAYYTRLSESAASGNMAAFRADFSKAMRAITVLITLSASYLLVVAFPFSRVLSPDFAELGWVLVAYLVFLLPFSWLSLTQRAFYALADTRTPFYFTCVQVVLVSGGTIACLQVAAEWRTMATTLVLAAGSTIQSLLALYLLRARVRLIGLRALMFATLRSMFAALVASALGVTVVLLMGGGPGGGWAVKGILEAIATMAIVGVLMSVSYFVTLRISRSPELALAIEVIGSKIPARLRRALSGVRGISPP